MSAYQPELPKGRFATLPNELILQLAHHMSIRSLRSLSVTSKRCHSLLDQKFLFEEEVEDERLFDEAKYRFWDLSRKYGLGFSLRDKAIWHASQFAPAYKPLNYDDQSFLNACIDRWGKGVLSIKIGGDVVRKMLRDWSLINELSVSLLRGDLIIRAIEKCRDINVIEQVIDAYLKRYPASLQGLKNYHLRTNFDPEGVVDVPPVIWACSRNRVNVLELLHTKNNEEGKSVIDMVDINIIFNQIRSHVIYGIRQNQDTLVDAWQAVTRA
ncbi:hypothetical protein PG997_014325 [Apiospora hydei]|uniref:F-box domain-containing protein n=1 Tax=Apiospora hydei TaxID=1337664 RepID=A0ABR1UTG7_9PEZI